MRDNCVADNLEKMKQDGRYAQRMDMSESTYSSDRKSRLRKLIDGGKGKYSTIENNYSSVTGAKPRSYS